MPRVMHSCTIRWSPEHDMFEEMMGDLFSAEFLMGFGELEEALAVTIGVLVRLLEHMQKQHVTITDHPPRIIEEEAQNGS